MDVSMCVLDHGPGYTFLKLLSSLSNLKHEKTMIAKVISELKIISKFKTFLYMNWSLSLKAID